MKNGFAFETNKLRLRLVSTGAPGHAVYLFLCGRVNCNAKYTCTDKLKGGFIMGFIKNIGIIAGAAAGGLVGGPIYFVGELTNIDLLRDIGEGALKVTERTGELLGSVTEGVAETVYGTVKKDSDMQSKGFEKVVESGGSYIKGVGKGMEKMVKDGLGTAGAIINGDTDKAVKTAKEIVKTVAVGVIAVGVIDFADGMDAFDLVENPNEHYVTPHERILSDGSTIWVDGDGDTAVDTNGGWVQSNPDYKA